MKSVFSAVVLISAFCEVMSYPAYYPYYGQNYDTFSYGANDESQSAMALSRYYQPYYNTRALGGGMAAFMFGQHQPRATQPSQDYYLPDRRRQTQPSTHYLPPQQNEVFYPQTPDKMSPVAPTEQNEAYPTERVELATTTLKPIVPELTDAEEVEEATQKPNKRVSKKKQVKRPVDDEDEEDFMPRMPSGAFFPMFFGWGGRSGGGGGPGGPTAIANAYSTSRGGVASSHATAYGAPRPQEDTQRKIAE